MREPAAEPENRQVDPLILAVRLLSDATARMSQQPEGGKLADKIALGLAWAQVASVFTGQRTFEALTKPAEPLVRDTAPIAQTSTLPYGGRLEPMPDPYKT